MREDNRVGERNEEQWSPGGMRAPELPGSVGAASARALTASADAFDRRPPSAASRVASNTAALTDTLSTSPTSKIKCWPSAIQACIVMVRTAQIISVII